jgi:TBC1 domain family protein 5
MLDDPIASLRGLDEASALDDKQKVQDVLGIAAAKLQFIKIYLEDSTMALPDDDDGFGPASPSTNTVERRVDSEPLSDAVAAMALNTPMVVDSPDPSGAGSTTRAPSATPSHPKPSPDQKSDTDPLGVETSNPVQTLQRPQPPIPTRSTLAQSSFSWMLEPDSTASSTSASAPASHGSTSKSASVFGSASKSDATHHHRKRPSVNATRERTAFLFGEVPSDADGNAIRDEDIFGLEPIRKG